MNKIFITFFLISLLITSFGCVSETSELQSNISNISKSINRKADKTSDLPENILFKGESMTLRKVDQINFGSLNNVRRNNNCLAKTEQKIRTKFLKKDFRKNTKYFEIEAKQIENSGHNKFVFDLDQSLFSEIKVEFLNKIDVFATNTDSRKLFLVEKNKTSYLLLIGHESATSGMGHYIKSHLLIPLDTNKPAIEFSSISDNPKRIQISDSGKIFYFQIDYDYKKMKSENSKQVPLKISLFSEQNTNENIAKINMVCDDINSIFDDD